VTNLDTAREDLAFMRSLVEPDDRFQRQFGETYATAGACYSVQMLLHGAQLLGFAPGSGPIALAIGLGPTVVFLLLLVAIIRRYSLRPVTAAATTSRAVGSVFGAVGATNLVLIVAIGSIAWRMHSLTIWLIYPCVVMVLQGMAWLVAYMMRRRGWLGVVALGWFVVGVAMAAFFDNPAGFVISAGVGMVLFMLLPGLYLLRQAQRAG
jgi:hypothetical protein